ncbi:uncharacterized protein J8A68_003115 [[Candida] subhashii]|uniref:Vacuolar sorting protein Vps3844 C-terminal domain-containing protein n=1 Tax=[Candida] subhashii TaxID=561895 RepID=A0A8J5QPI2_9ASCO|nr:uncharacterized protein J8A68_003115 [[Candida] subhashii]KAG7663367.1 hypothetical protein J8A68_003115 [[Candida] subhashii]
MRFINLVSWSFLALSCTVSAKHSKQPHGDISVYELNNKPHTNSQISTISAHEAFAYFGDKLGIEDRFQLGGSDSKFIEFLNEQHNVNEEELPSLFVYLRGVEGLGEPSFMINHKKNVHQLLFKKLPKLLSKYGNQVIQLTPEIKLITKEENHESLIDHFNYFNEKLLNIWKSYTSKDNQMILSYQLSNDRLFINELSQLIHLGKTKLSPTDSLFIELSSLLSIKHKIGDSQTYHDSQQILFKELNNLSSKFNIIVISNPSHENIRQVQKRDSELSSILKKRQTAFSKGFDSKDACEVATDKCSSHGDCVESGSVWACACKPSFNKKTSKTTRWVGSDCAKKDISVEANLFLWTTLGLLVLFVGGIKLLMNIGNEPLPGVLDAATIPRKNA